MQLHLPMSSLVDMKVKVVHLETEYAPFKERFHFVAEEAPEGLFDDEASIYDLEVRTNRVAHNDINTCSKFGGIKGLGCGMLLSKNFERSCRSHPLGPSTDLTFLGRRHPTRDGTCKAIIP